MLTDFRYALRMFAKNRGFTAVAVLTLALGIGANATVFCWVQNCLLRPIPGLARDAEFVVLSSFRRGVIGDTISLPDLRDYEKLTNIFSGVIGSQVTPACFDLNGDLQWFFGQVATENFFDVLGVRPILGRGFVREEGLKPGGAPVLILSEDCWRRQFGADPGILGRAVMLNRRSFTIVGVMPSEFRGTMGGLNCDFWAPLTMHEEVANFGSLTRRGDRWLHSQGRLRPGVSRTEAQAAVTAMGAQLEAAYPKDNLGISVRVLPLWKSPYGVQPILLPVLSILLVVSLGVLLIVAANVANLLLAKSIGRRKEIAIRTAMGARSGHLVRLLLIESVLLALMGGLAGTICAIWAVDLLHLFLPNTHLPIGLSFELDRQTIGFTLLISLATGLVFGLAPAVQSARTNLNATLREGGRSSGTGSSHSRLRGALVISEIALALLLLVGAGLCLRGFERARKVDLGFDPQHVLLAGMRIGMQGYTEETGKVFYRRVQERMRELPGVEDAALASWFPLGFEGGSSTWIEVHGHPRQPGDQMGAPYSIVSPGYFRTMRIPILDGRDFLEEDTVENPQVAIINEMMAKSFWPGENPVGRVFSTWRGDARVVGVVGNGKYRSLAEPAQPFFYFPYQQGIGDMNLGVAVRTMGDSAALIGVVRREIRALDPAVKVWAALPMIDFIQAAYFAQRIASGLLLCLGLTALLLASIGIYGVMAFAVNQRTQELGIRMALGAQRSDVHRMVIGQGMRLAVFGVGVGLVGALALTHLLSGFLFGVRPFDPATFLSVSVTLLGVAWVACYFPARSATRVDPLVALRAD